MKILCVLGSLLGWLLYEPVNSVAHSADEVMQTLDRGPIPSELLEATKALEATAGQKSIREDAHAKQHELLKQYIRAGTDRKCSEAIADIAKLDASIVRTRDEGNVEDEKNCHRSRMTGRT